MRLELNINCATVDFFWLSAAELVQEPEATVDIKVAVLFTVTFVIPLVNF